MGSLPLALRWACRRRGVRLTRHLLLVWVGSQRVDWMVAEKEGYRRRRRLVASTSRFGTGQVQDSNRTPLGLHRVAAKIGHGWPQGTVFRARLPVGLTWAGQPEAPIAHRILWLEGLEPGWNAGGCRDSRRRFIYIHGLGDHLSLGRPASRGCVHLGAGDLIELEAVIPRHTLVWISAGDAPPRWWG